jgi:membrane-associated protease RseP (regulator of RpoE activity)
VRSRAALLVIGAAGPICGFAVALVTIVLGIHDSTVPKTDGISIATQVQIPGIIRLIYGAMLHTGAAVQPIESIVPHPILTASWIGLLITALNLIPAGQLDGGHIVYALSRKAHRICSAVTIAGMAILGLVGWVGWLLWSAALLTPAMRHPKVIDDCPLSWKHLTLAVACLAILAGSGMPAPFKGFGLIDLLKQFHGFAW